MKILTTEVQQYDKTLQVLEEYSFCVFLSVHMICLCLSMIDLAVMLILDCFLRDVSRLKHFWKRVLRRILLAAGAPIGKDQPSNHLISLHESTPFFKSCLQAVS